MDRYVGAMQGPDSSLEVNVRGFSAGSYSGLAFLHILWSISKVTTKGCLGAIACPPPYPFGSSPLAQVAVSAQNPGEEQYKCT